ncbi:Mrp/NBP35 family ATP-binding protein [Exiguobacterium acetylicum]|uniref:Mrp/NBP35 family ATP-binding protein n=1 Tax=Exiguobacterium acetylicum TaxID=41170 RepID=UPI000680FBBC|nr:Mrp/NBP35 family ATP-binding protein [Exiguobacterium acetylicum]KNH37345.1 chromosome partitioning protein ParA [Exiguobacterium acetylicum]
MLNEQEIREVVGTLVDPTIDRPLADTNGIRDVRIKGDYVSLKIALAQSGSGEQLVLQQQIVKELKEKGFKTVGLRFEALGDHGIQAATTPSILKPESGTTFIAIASGKGGVGKSTVSVNLAVALARAGKKVGLIDADIYGFSVPDMMGIETRPTVVNDRIVPPERFGVKVISMGFFVEDNAPVIWRGPMLGKMLNNFFADVEWGDLDYLLLDLPPGTGDVALDIHSMLPSCQEVIVTTPHATAAFVAARAGAMAIKTNHRLLGIVENMAYFESKVTGEKEYVFGSGGGERLSEALKTDILAKIPLGQPYANDADFAPSIYRDDHPFETYYSELATRVIEKVEG